MVLNTGRLICFSFTLQPPFYLLKYFIFSHIIQFNVLFATVGLLTTTKYAILLLKTYEIP